MPMIIKQSSIDFLCDLRAEFVLKRGKIKAKITYTLYIIV